MSVPSSARPVRPALPALLCAVALLLGACSGGAPGAGGVSKMSAGVTSANVLDTPADVAAIARESAAPFDMDASGADAAAVKLSLNTPSAAQGADPAAPAGKVLSDEELSRLTVLTLDSSLAMIGGEVTDLVADQPALYPYLRESKTYVPLEFVEKGLGAEATHNEERGSLRIKYAGELVLTLGSAEYDFATTGRDYNAYTLYVPLRRVAEALGKSVGYYDGLIFVGVSPIDAGISNINAAQIAELRRALTGATAVGSKDKLGKLLDGVATGYGGPFDDYLQLRRELEYLETPETGLAAAVDGMLDSVGGMFAMSGEASTAGGGTGGAASASPSSPDRDNAVAAADADTGAQRAPTPTAAPTTAAAPIAAAAAIADSAAQEMASDAADYSGTNVQVEGVDEADVVKTDGRYIYQVNNQRILIVDAYPPSGMKKVSQVEYESNFNIHTADYNYAAEDGVSLWPNEMYVDGDTMVIIGYSQRTVPREPPSVSVETETGEDGVTRDGVTVDGGGAGVAPGGASVQWSGSATVGGGSASGTTSAAPAATAPPATTAALQTEAPDVDIAVDVEMEASYNLRRVVSDGFLSQTTRVLVYDIKDRTAPRLVRDSEIDGSYQSSRKIGGALYLVANHPLHYRPHWVRYAPMNGDADPRPDTPAVAYRDSASAASGAAGFTNVDYSSIYYFPGCVGQNYLVVAGIDTRNAEKPVSVHALLANGRNVYASSDYLYVAATDYRAYNWDPDGNVTTAVHRFKLDDGAIEYDGMGEVNGEVLNQFSMDESGGYFRIATTSGSYDERNGYVSRNNLYILDGGLKIVGRLEGLAPGEQIYSARFIGTRGYIVTFKTVDPLFVIDLADPTNPTVLGSLKIPGYSDYLHPYDENHIIGFGKDTVEYNQGGDRTIALYQGMKVALFDVSDVANPVELFKTEIGDRGTDSELLYNHRALLFSKERGLLAFPVTVATVPESQKTGDPAEDMFTYGQFEFQGAYVYDLNLTDGFTLKGKITHISDAEYKMYGSDYWNQDSNAVDRLLYIRDTLYAISRKYITAHDMQNPAAETGRVALD